MDRSHHQNTCSNILVAGKQLIVDIVEKSPTPDPENKVVPPKKPAGRAAAGKSTNKTSTKNKIVAGGGATGLCFPELLFWKYKANRRGRYNRSRCRICYLPKCRWSSSKASQANTQYVEACG
jgi:hypothetical protein